MRPYLGTNVNLNSVEELHYRKLLEERETLLAMFDGLLFDEHSRRVGGLALNDFVILTDQRLITWVRGLWTDTVDGFLWKDVDVVESRVWDPFHGRVRLAIRLPGPKRRTRRINMKGAEAAEEGEGRIIINTLDYMPAEDVFVMADMVAWVGDQVLASVTGRALEQSFVANFPIPERPAPSRAMNAPMAPSQRALPEPEPEPEPEPKRSWWPFGKKQATPPPTAHSSESLIAAYEQEHGKPEQPPPKVASAPLPPSPTSPLHPMSRMIDAASQPMADQVGIYGLSRSLRLAIEAPQRLRETLNRASEAVSGTSELLENLQNSDVRRTAITGLNFALNQQESQQGPLASVAPVVRAALGMGDQQGGKGDDSASSKRIQVVRTGGRVQDPSAATAASSTASSATASPGKIAIKEKSKERDKSNSKEGTAAQKPALRQPREIKPYSSGEPVKASKPATPATSPSNPSKPVVSTTVRVRRQSDEPAPKPTGKPAPANANGTGTDNNGSHGTEHTADASLQELLSMAEAANHQEEAAHEHTGEPPTRQIATGQNSNGTPAKRNPPDDSTPDQEGQGDTPAEEAPPPRSSRVVLRRTTNNHTHAHDHE